MRALNHDYRSRCIYHITIAKAPLVGDFGAVVSDGSEVKVRLSAIGTVIYDTLREVPSFHSSLRLLQFVIMPDHLHLLVDVRDPLPRPLGSYIGMLKVRITQRLRDKIGLAAPALAPDFHDRILRPWHSLQHIFDYIRDNPRRLWVRYQHPEFFRRINTLTINGMRWHAYGNLALFDNPFKEAVVVHRADGDAVKAANKCRYLHTAANGGVLVSPFISPEEQNIRHEAEALGGRLIVVGYRPFGERFKPAAHDFGLCEKGQLLLLAPERHLAPGRSTFLWLNKYAYDLCHTTSQAK